MNAKVPRLPFLWRIWIMDSNIGKHFFKKLSTDLRIGQKVRWKKEGFFWELLDEFGRKERFGEALYEFWFRSHLLFCGRWSKRRELIFKSLLVTEDFFRGDYMCRMSHLRPQAVSFWAQLRLCDPVYIYSGREHTYVLEFLEGTQRCILMGLLRYAMIIYIYIYTHTHTHSILCICVYVCLFIYYKELAHAVMEVGCWEVPRSAVSKLETQES